MPGTQDWGAPIIRILDLLPDPRHQDQVPRQHQDQAEMMMTELAMMTMLTEMAMMMMGTATCLKGARRLQKPIPILTELLWRRMDLEKNHREPRHPPHWDPQCTVCLSRLRRRAPSSRQATARPLRSANGSKAHLFLHYPGASHHDRDRNCLDLARRPCRNRASQNITI